MKRYHGSRARRTGRVAAGSLGMLLAAPALSQVEFVPLAPVSGAVSSDALAVTPDGRSVVGFASITDVGWQAFRWTAGQGMSLLSDQRRYPFADSAWGISADGSVIVGLAESRHGLGGFRWEDDRLRLLRRLPGGSHWTLAYNVSADGSIIVGSANDGVGPVATRWVNGKPEPLVARGSTGDYMPQSAQSVSADGSVIAGVGQSPLGQEAFVWDRGELIRLGDLPGGRFDSSARGVSADGRVVVGSSWVGVGTTAPFYWTRETGMVQIDQLTPGRTTNAWAVSADGWRVLGGGVGGGAGGLRGGIILWDPINGTRTLQHMIEEVYHHPLGDWWLDRFGNITPDGTVIVGSGINPAGDRQAFLVRIPPFCHADCDQSTGAGTLDVFDFLCFQERFLAGDSLYADCDRDGALTVFDLLCFQNEFVAGCP